MGLVRMIIGFGASLVLVGASGCVSFAEMFFSSLLIQAIDQRPQDVQTVLAASWQ